MFASTAKKGQFSATRSPARLAESAPQRAETNFADTVGKIQERDYNRGDMAAKLREKRRPILCLQLVTSGIETAAALAERNEHDPL